MKFPGNWIGNRAPWTFRLDAHTGQVIDGEEFGGMGVAPVRLFDDLMRLHGGDTEGYRKARDLAWKWILNNPLYTSSQAWDGHPSHIILPVVLSS